jgi:hypothetical protein
VVQLNIFCNVAYFAEISFFKGSQPTSGDLGGPSEASKIQEEERKRAIATMAAKFPHLSGKLFSDFDIFRFRVVQ